MKIKLIFLFTAMLASLIGFSQNVNFSDESDGKSYKVQYIVVVGDQLSLFKTRISNKIFKSTGLKRYLLDSRKTSDGIMLRVFKKKGEDSGTDSAERIMVYTVQRGNGNILQGDFVVSDTEEIATIMKSL